MRILLSGGFKTVNIANAIRPKFESNGDEIVVEQFVENIENLYLRGDSFDKIIITEQSLTQDFNIKDDNIVRNRINTFAQQQELHDNKIVFLTQYSKLASAIIDETLSIKDKSIVVLKQPRYTVTFFQELITSDFSQLPREWIYGLENAIQTTIENNNRKQEEAQESTPTTNQTEPEWEEPESEKESEFETPGFEDPDEWSDPDEPQDDTPIVFDDPTDWGTDTQGNTGDIDWGLGTEGDGFEPNENGGNQGVNEFDDPDAWGEQPSNTEPDPFETPEDPFENSRTEEQDPFENGGTEEQDPFENGEPTEFAEPTSDIQWSDTDSENGFDEQAGNAFEPTDNTYNTYNTYNTGNDEPITNEVPESGEETGTQWNEDESFENIPLQNRPVEDTPTFEDTTQSFEDPQNDGLYATQGFTENPIEEPTQSFEEPSQTFEDISRTSNTTWNPNDELESPEPNWEEQPQSFEKPTQQNNTTFIGIPTPQQNNPQSFGDWEESSGNSNNDTDAWGEQSTSSFGNDIYENPNNSQANYGTEMNNVNSAGFDELYGNNNNGYNSQNGLNTGNNSSIGNQNQGGGSFDMHDYDNTRAQGFDEDIYNETPQEFQPVNTSTPPMMQGMNINQIMMQLQNELKPFANRGNSIVFTGCGGCGTSILAYSVAKLASVLGFNTLLVDMDTEGRAQDYISRDNYISMNTDGASLMAAINSGASLESNVTKPNPGLNLLTMGIGGDTAPVTDIIHKDKISRFVNAAKSKYHFVIYDIPFKDATSYLSEITYNADNLALVIDASNWGMTKAMINVCNIPSEEMQSTIFNKSQVIFNKYRGMQEYMGKRIRNMKDVLSLTDDKVLELVGEDIGYYFSDMSIVGVINEDPNFEMGWFKTQQYVDTPAGQVMFCNLLRNIVLNK